MTLLLPLMPLLDMPHSIIPVHRCPHNTWSGGGASLLRAVGCSIRQLNLVLFAAVVVHAALVFFNLIAAVGGGGRVLVLRQERDGAAGGEVGRGGEGKGQRQGRAPREEAALLAPAEAMARRLETGRAWKRGGDC